MVRKLCVTVQESKSVYSFYTVTEAKIMNIIVEL